MEFSVTPIAPGYQATIPIAYPNAFADEAGLTEGDLVAQFRDKVNSGSVLFQAGTVAGTIRVERGDAETLVTITIPPGETAGMRADRDVVFDIVRINGPDQMIVPGLWRWPVRKTVTRDVG